MDGRVRDVVPWVRVVVRWSEWYAVHAACDKVIVRWASARAANASCAYGRDALSPAHLYNENRGNKCIAMRRDCARGMPMHVWCSPHLPSRQLRG